MYLWELKSIEKRWICRYYIWIPSCASFCFCVAFVRVSQLLSITMILATIMIYHSQSFLCALLSGTIQIPTGRLSLNFTVIPPPPLCHFYYEFIFSLQSALNISIAIILTHIVLPFFCISAYVMISYCLNYAINS